MEMEYRRRSSRTRGNAGGSSGAGRALILLLIFGAVVYLIVGTGVGRKLKDGYAVSLIESCRGRLAPAASEAPSAPATAEPTPYGSPLTVAPSPSGEALQADLPGLELYMLQYGFYEDEQLCAQAAQPLKELGAAGYCFNDGDDFRLILAAFTDESSAMSVRQAIGLQGYECTVYRISKEGVSLLITASKELIEPISRGFMYARELVTELRDVSIGFDSESTETEEGLKKLEALRARAASVDAGIRAFEGTSGAIGILHSYYSDVLEMLDETLENTGSKVRFSSGLKNVFIGTALRYCCMLDNITNGNNQ